MTAIVLVKVSDGKFYIKLNRDDNTIVGYKSVADGLNEIENVYNKNHLRGYEASMSACIHSIQFQYAVVLVGSIESLREKLLSNGVSDKELQVADLSSVAGWMRGILADQEKAAPVWEAAEKPRLISLETGGTC